MPLYTIGKQLEYLNEIPFKLEREIQKLTEDNLDTIFNLAFIRSEFTLNGFRIDTLAYDDESNAFVIIEYKKDKNFSVIDQGYAYLSLMLNNKADFILEHNEQTGLFMQRKSVDWSQSKVIFISPSFTTYQREAINFKDLPIELWEVKKYENSTILYEQIQKAANVASIKTISRIDDEVKKVSEEVKVFTEQEHLQKVEFQIRELYELLRERILGLDDNITLNPRKFFIGYKINGNSFCDIILQGKTLKIILNLKSGELEDVKNLSRDISNVGHWGNGAYEVKIFDSEQLDYILILINQSLKKNKTRNGS